MKEVTVKESPLFEAKESEKWSVRFSPYGKRVTVGIFGPRGGVKARINVELPELKSAVASLDEE